MTNARPIAIGPIRVQLASSEPAFARRFAELFAAFESPGSADEMVTVMLELVAVERGDGTSSFESRADGTLVLDSSDLHEHELALTRVLNKRRLDAEPGLLHLHCGAVARDERAVLLVGGPGAGKSTLTAALVRAGWEYLTDEQAALRPDDGRVEPYPRPITLRESSWRLFEDASGIPPSPPPVTTRSRIEVSPLALGAVHGSAPVEVGAVVEVRFAERGRDSLSRISTGAEVVERLAASTYDVERLGHRGIELLCRVAARCGGWRLEFDDIRLAVRRVREAFAQSDPRRLSLRVIPPAAAWRRPHPGTVVRIAEAYAWQFGDGSGLVYHPPSLTLARLDRGGMTLWEHLDRPRLLDVPSIPTADRERTRTGSRRNWIDVLLDAGLLTVGEQ